MPVVYYTRRAWRVWIINMKPSVVHTFTLNRDKMSFFEQPANKDIICNLLLRQRLCNRDGLALVLTCKFLYGLTTPIWRMQMQAGLRFKMIAPLPRYKHFSHHPAGDRYSAQEYCKCPDCDCYIKCGCAQPACRIVEGHQAHKCKQSALKRLHAPCSACGNPTGYHLRNSRHCPLALVTCTSECKQTGTVQMLTPWLAGASFKHRCIECACCHAILRDFIITDDSCARCGIYCQYCRRKKCPGCEQAVRGKEHVCVAYVDRLAIHVRNVCGSSPEWQIKTLLKFEEPLIMVAGVFWSGVRFKWVMILDRNCIPPIPHQQSDSVFLFEHVHGTEFVPLLHFDASNPRHGKTHIRSYIEPNFCVVCFQTGPRVCSAECRLKFTDH